MHTLLFLEAIFFADSRLEEQAVGLVFGLNNDTRFFLSIIDLKNKEKREREKNKRVSHVLIQRREREGKKAIRYRKKMKKKLKPRRKVKKGKKEKGKG